MVIVYCQKCGRRVPEADVAAGRAVQTAESSWLCGACASLTASAVAPDTRRSGAVPRPPDTASAPSAPRQRPAAGRTTSSAPAVPAGARRSATAHAPKPAGGEIPPQEKTAKRLFAVGAVVLGVCFFTAGLALLCKGKGGSARTAAADTHKPTAASKETRPTAKPAEPAGANSPDPVRPPLKTSGEEPAAKAAAAAQPLSLAEREKQAEKEMQDFRSQRGEKLLADHKAWFQNNPGELWEYRTRLRELTATYRATPAAAEAERLLGELKSPPAVRGRFVRIENLGQGRILSLAEVQVFSADKNVALHKAASQSSLDCGGVPERAVDGNTDGTYEANSVTHTKVEDGPWWEVDLGEEYDLEAAVIWNRTQICMERLQNFRVSVLNKDRAAVWEKTVAEIPRPRVALALTPK